MSSQLNASLFRLKLIDALRAGEEAKTNALVSHLQSIESTLETSELIKLRETILHYAVQVAPLPLIQSLVSNEEFKLDVNAQDADGNTPLHLAAMSSRFNVVKYLMSLPNINDTIVNRDRDQPVELARDTNVAQLMQYERAKFVERTATELRKYFSARDFDNLENLLVTNQRAAELLDINGADPDTGNTVLHEFIRKEDFQMCEWILKHGGDPFKRDKKGKLPIDLVTNKSDPIRKLLKTASKDQNMMDPASGASTTVTPGSAPTYKGYLRKWTNFASGYKLRYFVLDQYGILSYYTNQGDTNNSCRGSLNLGYASLHLDSSEKLKFEIIGKNGIKWHLKANHPVETNRWVWTLQNAITISKDTIRKRPIKNAIARVSIDEGAVLEREETPVNEEEKKRRLLLLPHRKRLHKKTPSQVSMSSFTASDVEDSHSVSSFDTQMSHKQASVTSPTLTQILEKKPLVGRSRVSLDNGVEDFDFDLQDSLYSESGEIASVDLESANSPLSSEQLASTKRSVLIEVSSLLDMLKALEQKKTNDDTEHESLQVGITTLNSIKDYMESYDAAVSSREVKLLKKIERQQEVNKLWENSIKQLESEIQKHEQTLSQYEGKKYKLKKLLESKGITTSHVTNDLASGVFDRTPDESGNSATLQAEDSGLLNEFFYDSDEEFFDADEFSDAEDIPPAYAATQPESQTAPQTVVTPPAKKKSALEYSNETQEVKAVQLEEEGSFLGYELPPRKKLSMSKDNRPKVGLWGIIKSMVGQDMTRMSLPVSFNECTSLLQRLAEDIEYNDLLTKAAGIDDSTLRMVYVAAFAASEYSSTINRIAKPFNPLLGETFEYCRPDQGFRMLSEQVSHHPPISACHAEAPKWDYFGENAVKSQLRARSFDFQHLGMMFCVIRPDGGVTKKNGEKVPDELYSWKKVNTSVVGIILGNPSVDNYGTMEVKNHATGDVIRVEMKQRGWKASSAYQLSGTVIDAQGTPRWTIKGHWNLKIFARKVTEENTKRRDSISESEKTGFDPYSGNKFLVWQVAPRPDVPFNLTAFAVTLNDINDNLKPWLAPTDTRLRPDQRAMEEGRYDEAAAEKNRVENKQRAARKKREDSNEPYKPNWFVKLKHPVTGNDYWHYNQKYWPARKAKQLTNTGDIF